MNDFGNKVRKLRRQHDLTQEELARRVGCAAITVRKIEAGDLRPSKQIAELLAKALSIPLEERSEFVQQARSVKPRGGESPPTPTPQVKREEIGGQDLSGRAIRGYTLGERIGAGGFGVVYRAVQPMVEREVAVKIILPEYADHPEFIRRFEAEAQVVARLEHPHIVPLYDYWREPSVAYLVMRLLRGGSVQDRLDRGPLPLETVAGLMDQIGGALHAAHRLGVVHRDLKPANILLDDDDNAYLADFGIAKTFSNWEVETQVGAFIGSPAYSSPEQIRADEIMPQADIYGLGVLLFELLTGERPFTGPTPLELAQQHLSDPMPPLSSRQSSLPAALDAIIARATAKDPLERYSDVSLMAADIQQVASTGRLDAAGSATSAPEGALNPYKGLRSFGEADAADFYGRETLTQQLLSRLSEGGDLRRFLAIVGPSGSGKSSVVRAGLIPALRRGALPGSEDWFVVDLIPGAHPLRELEQSIERVAVNPIDGLLSPSNSDRHGLLKAISAALPDDGSTELVLVIDQFEEVFTLLQDEAERTFLLDNLVNAVLDERSRARVVVTLRADFIDHPLRYSDFGELLKNRSELVLPLSSDEMENAVRGPAERVGLVVEPELVAAVIGDVTDQPGALPLMQYALTETFDGRENGALTLAEYRSIGGVKGALSSRADALYMNLDAQQRASAREMFLRLVTLGEGAEDTRRRVLHSELESLAGNGTPSGSLPDSMGAVLEQFGEARMLSFDRDPITRGPTVEVGHEALLREWPRLRVWLDDSRADVRLQRSLAAAADEWNAAQRDPSYLLAGARLEQFDAWERARRIALTQEEQAYLEASREEQRRQEAAEEVRAQRERKLERRSRNFLRALAGVLAIAAVGALVLSGFAFNQREVAEESLATATAAQGVAKVEAAAALAAEEEALAQEAIAAEQRDLAEDQLAIATSRELSLAAVTNLEADPELSILLALQALDTAHTKQAEEALHSAIQANRMLLSLRGHEGGIGEIVYSPDGSILATSGQDRTVRLWDPTTGEKLEVLPFELDSADEWFTGLMFDDTGEKVALISTREGRSGLILHEWDLANGSSYTQQLLSIDPDFWSDFLLSPNWELLAVSFEDGTAGLWDLASGERVATLSGHEDWVWDLDFSSDGSMLASFSRNGQVMVWDVASSLASGSGQKLAAFVSPSSDQLGGGAFSFDGTRLALGFIGGAAEIWDLMDTTAPLHTLRGHTNTLLAVEFGRSDMVLATAGIDGVAKVWDVISGEELFGLFGHNGLVGDVAFSPDGRRIATGSEDATVRVWESEPTSGGELLAFTAESLISNLALSPDGSWFALGSPFGPAEIRDSESGEILQELAGEEGTGVYAVGIHPDGSRIATAGQDRIVRIQDSASGELLRSWSAHGEGVTGGLFSGIVRVAYSAGGSKLVTAGTDGIAKVWNPATGDELLTLAGHTAGLTGAEFSPDGRYIATSSDQPESSVKVWDAATGLEIYTLTGHPVRVWGLAFNPDSTILATAGNSGVVKLWKMATGEELYTLPNQVATVLTVQFSPDGTWLVTGADGGRIYNVETGEELLTFAQDSVGHMALSANGSRLYSATFFGTVTAYLLPFDEVVALAQTRVTRGFTPDECLTYLHMDSCPP
jgi:WD40 repeat protein/serine/threonine protein kinase/DNA-binding XRE family transcriptional regulator